MNELYDRLKFQYEKKGKEIPKYVLYSKKIRKEFNIDHHKKNIQDVLHYNKNSGISGFITNQKTLLFFSFKFFP